MGSELEGRLYAVTLSHGPSWDQSKALEGQQAWDDHAAFMDALVDDAFVVLGGPLEGASGALLIIRARSADEIRQRLAADPWHQGLLRIASIVPWTIRLGAL